MPCGSWGAVVAMATQHQIHNMSKKTQTFKLSRHVAWVAAPYLWDFIHLHLDGCILEVGEMLLSEEPPPWLGIHAKSSLTSECVERACV